MYDFDIVVDRTNTNSAKHEFPELFGMPNDLLNYWVADMDFATSKGIVDAIVKRAEHGVFGYSLPNDTYYDAVIKWYKTRFDFDIDKKWIMTTPGIVFAISCAIRGLTKEGDSIIIQTPVYYPFKRMIDLNGRKSVCNSLVLKEGKYYMDLEDFENKIKENNVKMFILCSPHNPVGRVWTKDELVAVAKICKKHNVIVIADEIHSDFVRDGYTHTVFQQLEDMEDITITCTSPSKTFNIAGLQISNIIIKNEELKKGVIKGYDMTGYDEPSVFGIVACEAAYTNGEQWLLELKEYIESNLQKTKSYLLENLPKIKLIEPEGTYLIWLDFSGYGLSHEELNDIIVNKCKLWFDEGTMFGMEGDNFQRINMACSWEYLKKALDNIADVFKDMV